MMKEIKNLLRYAGAMVVVGLLLAFVHKNPQKSKQSEVPQEIIYQETIQELAQGKILRQTRIYRLDTIYTDTVTKRIKSTLEI